MSLIFIWLANQKSLCWRSMKNILKVKVRRREKFVSNNETTVSLQAWIKKSVSFIAWICVFILMRILPPSCYEDHPHKYMHNTSFISHSTLWVTSCLSRLKILRDGEFMSQMTMLNKAFRARLRRVSGIMRCMDNR